jgi:fermentation-respiration switch protein FrsA (DUF1100 family)
VVLESSFSSYRGIAREKLGDIWLTWPLQWPLSFLFSSRYDPVDLIGGLPRCPLLIIHGDADEVVPLREGRALLAAARGPKDLWVVPGGGHLEALTRYGKDYRPRLAAFLETALERR